jgi:hypothetical protein
MMIPPVTNDMRLVKLLPPRAVVCDLCHKPAAYISRGRKGQPMMAYYCEACAKKVRGQ